MSLPTKILRGPKLEANPPAPGARRQPPTWTYGVRLGPELATKVDAAARQNGCLPVDVIRTATALFLADQPLSPNANGEPSNLSETKPQATHAGHSAPAHAQTYKGNGKQDLPALKAVNARNQDRKASGNSGERLKDTTSVR